MTTRLARLERRFRAGQAWLTSRGVALSKSMSAAMLVGLACLPTLAGPQFPEPPPAATPIGLPIAARRVKAIDIPPKLVAVRAVRNTKSESAPPGAAQPATAETPAPPATGSNGAPAAVPAAPAAPAAAAAAAAPPPPPPPPAVDVWGDAEIKAALQECVREMASIVAQVDTLAPIRQGQCGTPAPISLRSIGASKVELQPAAVTTCRMAKALHDWVENTLQPAAKEMLASPVKRLIGTTSYACRNRNNEVAGPISEHAFANAIDIAGFVLADGRTVTVLDGWGPSAREQSAASPPQATPAPSADKAAAKSAARKGKPGTAKLKTAELQRLGGPAGSAPVAASAPPAESSPNTQEAAFLRRLHKGACGVFGTVLGPEANAFHRNHFHLDLKARKSRAICQ